MKKKLFVFVLLIAIVSTSFAAEKTRIAVISKGYQHEFWRTVEAGVKQAAKDFKVDAYFIGPEKETEISKQVSMVENAINQKVDAIALAALDTRALVPVSKKAQRARIPLVTFDSGIKGNISKSFIATDNVEGGRIGGEELAKLINYEGKVIIISHNPGTSTAIDREKGALEVLKKYPKIKLLNTQFSDGDISKALAITQDVITANPDLKGIFATNEGTSLGVARGIEEKGKRGKVMVVAYDSSDDQVRYIKSKTIQGTVVQDPYNMGYQSIKAIVDILAGKKVSKRIDTGANYVSLANFNDAKIQKLIYPLKK